MGDRANVKFKYHDDSVVYFYTHWNGNDLPVLVRDALIRGRERWNDPSYLARVIFCEMVRDNMEGVTGYGISTRIEDNNRLLTEVNTSESVVRFLEEDGAIVHEWSFEDYVMLADDDIEEDFS